MNARVASPVAKRRQTQDLRNLGKFRKIAGMHGFDEEYTAGYWEKRF